MAYEHKPGSGSIFKNDKGDNEKRPDYTGTLLTPDGKEAKLSLWVKRPEGKAPFFSLSMEYKEQPPVGKVEDAVLVPEPKDDLPF
jgi:hypothetical protein